jgi:RNA polymerase sigma-70 factor (ECF subfamily)
MGSDEHEDKMLFQSLRRGNEKSFRRAYLKYHKQLYGTALKYLRSKTRAEDAVHDIFVKLWNNRKKLDTAGSLRGFLFTAIKNHVLNIISHQKRKLKKDIELSYEQKINRTETDNVIILSKYREVYQSAVGRLPAKRREVFELRIKEGLTNKEVANYLEISIHTVKSQYYKASKFVRAYVGEHINRETGS